MMKRLLLFILLLFLQQHVISGKTYVFMSYHLYTNENNKFESSGYMKVPSIVEINEDKQKVVLKLFSKGGKDNGWFSFDFTIDEISCLDNNIIIYFLNNNVGNKAYLYLSPNRQGGLYIDINNFRFDDNDICCWMQKPYKISN